MSAPSVSKAVLERKFIECGERDRMKLLQRLRESGWVEEVKNICRIIYKISNVGRCAVRVRARRAVPNEVKCELMHCIRSFY
uniref:Transcription and mRNA export factor ENY2 n=1 Tax=Wuchereria bancrofti TaxID=6293 RepID=A0AAF5Q6R3_WUCBA